MRGGSGNRYPAGSAERSHGAVCSRRLFWHTWCVNPLVEGNIRRCTSFKSGLDIRRGSLVTEMERRNVLKSRVQAVGICLSCANGTERWLYSYSGLFAAVWGGLSRHDDSLCPKHNCRGGFR